MFKNHRMVWVLLILIVSLTACSLSETPDTKAGESPESDTEIGTQKKVNPVETEPEKKQITLSAVGDVLIHKRVYDDARTDEGFDFMPMIENVSPFLQDSTITFANAETMIGGEAIGLSTYPRFNSPREVGDALKQSGVDVVSIANNHSMDRGEQAIQQAIKHWDSIGMMYAGAYKSQKDRQELRVMETDEGISVAFLAYTYGTNGIAIAEDKAYLVNIIDKNKIAEQIDRAKKRADAVVLSLHFGAEYERMPNQKQKHLVQFAADKGADVVLGHHPHVLQPMEWVEGKDGNQTLAIYSLGNFLSGQYKLYRRMGGMMQMTIEKRIDGDNETVEVSDPRFLPTFVKSKNENNYEVVPMNQLSEDALTDVQKHYRNIKDHMSQWMPDLEFIEK